MRSRNSMLLAVAALAAGLSTVSAKAETVVRYGISMADIPLTTGQPDRGAGDRQLHPLAEHQRHESARRGTQRSAHPELAPAVDDASGNHGIEAGDRKDEDDDENCLRGGRGWFVAQGHGIRSRFELGH